MGRLESNEAVKTAEGEGGGGRREGEGEKISQRGDWREGGWNDRVKG